MGLHPFKGMLPPLCLAWMLLGFISQATGQGCSASNPCATGCCSSAGYCGTGDDYCGASCVANCDYVGSAGECDENNPCALGCCSKFGVCGMGPDYCSSDNCVASCDAKAECDPDNWGSDWVNSTTCPLNVCCSKYGFCGTTEEFCGTKKVKRPSCGSDSSSIRRVVGYYEGWAPTRPCKGFWPEMIPTGVYTHLNYAFAIIDPETYSVMATNDDETDLMKRLVALKRSDPSLKVNIAIGGWSFNDPGATTTVFSDLAASTDKQNKFFASLNSLLSTYGFDGVDIDWEYPVADDRGGRTEDLRNFPTFMANLKSALRQGGSTRELSVTLPTSYWYLQHFDIEALQHSVDYFNYMSYDLHGTWDRGNKWTGAYLDSHTNLTEIELAMDLLWRNNISPDKVVLGLAFYARGFTLEDTSCTEPGCIFASGSDEGPCSGQTGILLNGEIDDIREERKLKPTLDEDAAVQILTWDDQWLTYDDASTFKLKIKFAEEMCLGGVMVWAVSHDSPNSTYTEALGQYTPPVTEPQILLETSSSVDGLTLTKKNRMRQCTWIGCGEVCKSPYVAVARSVGPGADDTLMVDSLTCPDGSLHTLCCPEDHGVKCGWYTHNNGKCDHTCPSGTFEIGSLARGGLCYNYDYQAACCTAGKDATTLYGTIAWSAFPECDDGGCPVLDDKKTKILANSTTGTGDGWCDSREQLGIAQFIWQERKLCYDDNQSGKKWSNCVWKNDIGLAWGDPGEGYCKSACPAGMTRVSMSMGNDCKGLSVKSLCCDDEYFIEKTYTNPQPKLFSNALDSYLIDGSCATLVDSTLATRDILVTDWDRYGPGSKLVQRDLKSSYAALEYIAPIFATLLIIEAAAYTAIQAANAESWDKWVTSHGWSGLVMDTLQPFVQGLSEVYEMGTSMVARSILCRPGDWNQLADGKEDSICSGDICDTDADPALCRDDDGEWLLQRRDGINDFNAAEQSLLSKEAHKFKIWSANDNDYIDGLDYYALGYPRAGEWDSQSTPYKRARTYENRQDCGNPFIFPRIKSGNTFATEHILEIQCIGLFFEAATKRKLGSSNPPTFKAIDAEFFIPMDHGGTGAFTADNILNLASLYTGDPGEGISSKPSFRIMGALGSKDNNANFYLLEDVVNGMKARIFGNKALVESTKWNQLINDVTQPGRPLKAIKAAIAVWHYLLDTEVKASWVGLQDNLRTVFKAIDDGYYQDKTFVPAWDEWWCDWSEYQFTRSKNWIHDGISKMRTKWTGELDTDPARILVLNTLLQLDGYASAILTFDKKIFSNCN